MSDNDKTYNGWTNYATWRINLEILSDLSLADDFNDERDEHTLADMLESYVDEILTMDGAKGLVLDYAQAFVGQVNFYEIAAAMIADADPLPVEAESEDAD